MDGATTLHHFTHRRATRADVQPRLSVLAAFIRAPQNKMRRKIDPLGLLRTMHLELRLGDFTTLFLTILSCWFRREVPMWKVFKATTAAK